MPAHLAAPRPWLAGWRPGQWYPAARTGWQFRQGPPGPAHPAAKSLSDFSRKRLRRRASNTRSFAGRSITSSAPAAKAASRSVAAPVVVSAMTGMSRQAGSRRRRCSTSSPEMSGRPDRGRDRAVPRARLPGQSRRPQQGSGHRTRPKALLAGRSGWPATSSMMSIRALIFRCRFLSLPIGKDWRQEG